MSRKQDVWRIEWQVRLGQHEQTPGEGLWVMPHVVTADEAVRDAAIGVSSGLRIWSGKGNWPMVAEVSVYAATGGQAEKVARFEFRQAALDGPLTMEDGTSPEAWSNTGNMIRTTDRWTKGYK